MKKMHLTKKKVSEKTMRFIFYFILVCVSFVFLEPIFRIISKTFMTSEDIIDPMVDWVPRSLSLNNLKVAVKVLKLSETLKNSILFSGVLAIAQTFCAALTGFALSRFNFTGKKFWFVMILLCFVVPTSVLMVPRLMMFVTAQEKIGYTLIGTPIPQVLMALLGQGVNSTILILIFQNFFNLIPKSLDEAAMIDGAGSFRVFWHIGMRLSFSTVLVVFLFAFVWNWNETYVTGTLLRSGLQLLPSKLSLFDSEFESVVSSSGSSFKLNEAYKMAATFISIAPLLLLYTFVQKKFIEGIENTGITGE
ncbi:MAG: carbohydrate ABC transporter permease [Lachnospiraceae bacterium]|nr:carbohydrate ABC transporter permease [Lachnospiraceae bacterium]